MRRFANKVGTLMAALALVITTVSVNSACIFYMHQPEVPEEAKKLRKF